MTETAEQLLATFDSLPANEQHEVLTAILKRSGELSNTLFPDEGLVDLADDLFQALDAKELIAP